jgi:hypothetical protein
MVVYLMGMYLMGMCLVARVPHGRVSHGRVPLGCVSHWAYTSPDVYLIGVCLMGVHFTGCAPQDVHLMGVVCVEAFRFFNLVFGKKSLYPTLNLLGLSAQLLCCFRNFC